MLLFRLAQVRASGLPAALGPELRHEELRALQVPVRHADQDQTLQGGKAFLEPQSNPLDFKVVHRKQTKVSSHYQTFQMRMSDWNSVNIESLKNAKKRAKIIRKNTTNLAMYNYISHKKNRQKALGTIQWNSRVAP